MTRRILEVFGAMNRGGAETWLMHVVRHIDRQQFQIDFLVHTTQPAAYDDELHALGSKVIPCMHPSRPRTYAHNLRRILQEHGPYDVVHSHVHHFSGYILRLAYQAGVPARIAHSHRDSSMLQAKARLPRRLYVALMQRWIHHYATCGLAASQKAAAALFGRDWERDPRYRLLYCGIDLEPFRQPVDRAQVRAELGIPPEAFVVGNVARFNEEKNHQFFVDIAAEITKRAPCPYFLLVGDGALRPTIEARVAELGLKDRFVFAGLRPDIPCLMKGAMDVFLLPSLFEGLPLVGLEAQAAGLPMVLSDTIAEELTVVRDLARQVSLQQPASVWAETVLGMHENVGINVRSEALSILEGTPFNIRSSTELLGNIYAHEK
ncbi:MAG TPA: glycosyltransferase [Aggregatilineales bacterium]|nr:glycosyltransferase [Aggregatilineales bacterium]